MSLHFYCIMYRNYIVFWFLFAPHLYFAIVQNGAQRMRRITFIVLVLGVINSLEYRMYYIEIKKKKLRKNVHCNGCRLNFEFEFWKMYKCRNTVINRKVNNKINRNITEQRSYKMCWTYKKKILLEFACLHGMFVHFKYDLFVLLLLLKYSDPRDTVRSNLLDVLMHCDHTLVANGEKTEFARCMVLLFTNVH